MQRRMKRLRNGTAEESMRKLHVRKNKILFVVVQYPFEEKNHVFCLST